MAADNDYSLLLCASGDTWCGCINSPASDHVVRSVTRVGEFPGVAHSKTRGVFVFLIDPTDVHGYASTPPPFTKSSLVGLHCFLGNLQSGGEKISWEEGKARKKMQKTRQSVALLPASWAQWSECWLRWPYITCWCGEEYVENHLLNCQLTGSSFVSLQWMNIYFSWSSELYFTKDTDARS